MEAIANRAWEMRQKFDLEPGVIINITTKENAQGGVWLGESGADKANCYSRKCAGVAIKVYRHLKTLTNKGLGCMVWADVNAALQREGGTEESMARFGNFVKERGAEEIFCAEDVSSDNVSLALCADGATADHGVVELVMPVWCEAAGMDITMRLTTCETAASSYFTCFSSTFCDRSRAGRHGRGAGRGVLRKDVRGRRRHDRGRRESKRTVPSDGPDLRYVTSFR